MRNRRTSALVDSRFTIRCPKILGLFDQDHHVESLNFFSAVRSMARPGDVRLCHLDLSDLEWIDLPAALVFFASVSTGQLTSGNPSLYETTLPLNRSVKKWFRNIGLWRAISPGGLAKLDRLWGDPVPFQSGIDPDTDRERTYQKHLSMLKEIPEHLDVAVSEAMLNVAHHAYDIGYEHPQFDAIRGRWWQFALVYNGCFFFYIYDIGLGIPHLLRVGDDYHPDEPLPRSGMSDADLVARAMVPNISRFRDYGRGRGSVDIVRPIQRTHESNLILLSGSGRYQFDSRNNQPVCSNYGATLPGTLLGWTFKIGTQS